MPRIFRRGHLASEVAILAPFSPHQRFEGDLEKASGPTGNSRWGCEPELPIATVPKVCPTQAHWGSFQRTWAHYQPMRERLRG